MGCGSSKVSQPKPIPNRAASGKKQQVIARPYSEQNGSLTSYDRRLSLVSEGSEDELRCTELMQGNVNMAKDDTARIIRIFTSNIFTDTGNEINALMERVYPRLKEFTQQHGYDFQVVDMRWGVRETATDDHMMTELCMRELKACQKLSMGPNFVTFLSHKYGYRPLSRVIDADKFEMILQAVTDNKARELLVKWYKRDDNAVPPSYILQPISSQIPEFLSKVQDEFKSAKDTWWSEHELMQDALCNAAQRTLSDSAEAHKFLSSVIEKEIEVGILNVQNAEEHCLWFRRNISNIESQEPNRLLSRYIECQGSEKTVQESRNLLHNLKEHLIPKRLPNDCILTYNVPWTKKGIDPGGTRSHAEYIDQLCSDFEMTLKNRIMAAINKRHQSQDQDDIISTEISQHALFCQTKMAAFTGRQEMIDKIETYLENQNRYPLVIHGESGCGKTSLMAVAAHKTWELHKGKAIVILRFIGTTPDSSSIRTLLHSIITQIRRLFQDEKPVPTDMKELVEELNTVLHLASSEQPIIIVLDSLDQLSPDNNARQLFWLPHKLPRKVKMLLSTLPGEEYECLPRLKMMLQKPRHFLPMSELTESDANSMLTAWLEKSNRCLQPNQRQCLLQAFTQCKLPLYLKLCFDEACRWPSYMEPSQTDLETTLQKLIQMLFNRVERSHGRILVSRVLGYLTISRSGLSETELEDVLSLDDDVLNDVFQYWTPPLRRLPPLLAIRVKADLAQYLVDRVAESTTVTYWYHRQFVEVARTKYASDKTAVKQMHINLSEYYREVWAEKPKPYIHPRTGETCQAMRHVARQPYKYDTRYNLRKLMELPLHAIYSEQISVLKDELMCNLKWLTAKTEATSLRHVLDDFTLVRRQYPDDEDLKMVGDVLQLSQSALNQDPHQLPGQLLGRISHGNNKLTAQCCRPPYPALIPSEVILKEPGGQLLNVMSEHADEVNSLDLTKDGRFAVTCSDDHTVKLWDIHAGKLHKSIDNVGDQPNFLRFCCDDKFVVVLDSNNLYLINVETSSVKIIDEDSKQLSGDSIFKFLVFNGGSTLVIPVQKGVAFLELPSGAHRFTVTDPFLKSRGSYGSFSDILDGHKNFIAITGSANTGSTLHYEVHILDVRQQKFIHNVTLFQPPQNEDEEEYTVDALAMTHDETLVIAAEMLNNNLHFISVETGELIRKLEGNSKDSSDQFHITPDDRFLYFCNIDRLCVWDLETGERSYTLHHPIRAADIQTRDQQMYVSISVDTVCIWDITRTDSHQAKDEDKAPYRVSCMATLPHTDRYIAVLKTSSEKHNLPTLLCIYDVLQEEYIRQIQFPHSTSCHKLYVTDDDKAIIVYKDSIVVINIKDSTFKICQGKIPRFDSRIYPMKSKPWIVSFTRGRLKIKVYNWQTGRVEFILGADQEFKLEFLEVSSHGNVAAAMGETYPIFIFDLASRCLRHNVFMSSDIYTPLAMKLSDDGSYLVQTVLKEDDEGETVGQMEYALVFDCKSGQPTHHLVDWEAFRKIEEEHTDYDLSVTEFILFKNKVITAHYDHKVRIWNANTGAMLQLLPMPGREEVNTLQITPDSSRLLTITHREQVIIWDSSSWHNLASFKMDIESPFLNSLSIGDGSLILLKSETKDKFNQLRLVGSGIKPKRDQKRLKEIHKPNLKLDEKMLIFDIPEVELDDPDLEPEEDSDIDSDQDDVDDQNSFTINSDIPALSQGKTLDDFDIGETNDLDLELTDSDDDRDEETKTRSTMICDSFVLKNSAKSKVSERY